MAIKASNHKVRRREFTWEYEGDDCLIVYNANGITSRKLQQLRELPDNEADTALMQTLADTLIEWQVEQDDGRMWPLVVDWPEGQGDGQPTLRDLPLSFINDCLDACGNDAQARSGG